MSEPNCLFCRMVAGTIPVKQVYEDDLALAFHDISPKAPQHVLIIPKEHIASLNEATEYKITLGHLLTLVPPIAASLGLAETGYRTVINTGTDGGKTVFHLHIHLLGGRPLAWPPG
jgi:histidine triad (HIT) family protein